MSSSIETFTVEEMAEFAKDKLRQPDDVCSTLIECDIDGESFMMLTEANTCQMMKLSVGKAIKLLNAREKYVSSQSSSEPPSHSQSTSEPLSQSSQPSSALSLQSSHSFNLILDDTLDPLPKRSSTPYKRTFIDDEEEDNDDEFLPAKKRTSSDSVVEDEASHSQGDKSSEVDNAEESTSTKLPVAVVVHKSVPYPGEFCVNDIRFGPLAKESFRTGKVDLASQSEILKPLYNKIIMYSNDPHYCDRNVRKDAATALIMKYPKLKQGRSFNEAVMAYKLSLIQRGKESREKLKKMGVLSERQKMELHKYKNRKDSDSNDNLNDTRRFKDPNVSVTKDEEEKMMQEQAVLKVEMGKRYSERNKRTLHRLHESTFPLRRKEIVAGDMSAADALRNWPSISMWSCAVQDLTAIAGVETDLSVLDKFADMGRKIILHARGHRRDRSLARHHPIARLLTLVEETEDGNSKSIVADSDTNLCVAIALLPHLLATTTKKPLADYHRFVIDCYAEAESPMACVGDLPGRKQPCIMIGGSSFAERNAVIVAADGKFVGKFANVKMALSMVVSLHYILNVQYNPHIKLAMLFIDRYMCGLTPIKGESYKSVVALNSKLNGL